MHGAMIKNIKLYRTYSLYECEAQFVTVREECRLMMFENRFWRTEEW